MHTRLIASGFIALAVLSSQANAELDILVVDAHQGTPVANAAVCLGTAANQSQFGSALSDTLGRTRFESPPSYGVQVVVSAKGYQGQQRIIHSSQNRQLVKIALPRGGLGAQCKAAAHSANNSARNNSRITINSATLLPAGKQWKLRIHTSGEVNQMRVGKKSDFDKAPWVAFEGESLISSQHPVFVQVRRAVIRDGVTLANESQVVEARAKR